jgi:hypothetical protein
VRSNGLVHVDSGAGRLRNAKSEGLSGSDERCESTKPVEVTVADRLRAKARLRNARERTAAGCLKLGMTKVGE